MYVSEFQIRVINNRLGQRMAEGQGCLLQKVLESVNFELVVH